MLFNSIEFAVFLPVVFILYWFVFNHSIKVQNFFLFVVSYIFYGWWDWRFLFLIFLSSLVDYIIALRISKQTDANRKKWLLAVSLLVNLGALGFFKYYNFFVESFVDAFTFFGTKLNVQTLKIILPVGISFYTFQTLSYTIDAYKGKITPTRDIVAFFAFVSFFPQLVAGPIERATNLLPQFYTARQFEYEKAKDGLRQILWGLFKKIVIADTCAIYVNQIFNNYADLPGSELLLGAVYFAFQIYGDFSGYSDIAIGTARLFGFDLMRNFAYPLFCARHCRILAKMAHIAHHLVQGLCVHSFGGQPDGHGNVYQKCNHRFSGEWLLAWGQLDVHRLGRIECCLFCAPDAGRAKQAACGSYRRKQVASICQGVFSNDAHLWHHAHCLGFFQVRKRCPRFWIFKPNVFGQSVYFTRPGKIHSTYFAACGVGVATKG